MVAERRKKRAREHVDPGNVTAQSAAIHISGWKYICSAMNGSNNPFAVKNKRTTRSSPRPVKTIAAKRVAALMKL
jgi:hypothetical protein